MTERKGKPSYPTPALEKGLDILELFAAEAGALTKSDVARRLNRTVSEIFRMLVCLEERGYISQEDTSDRYRLTLQLFHMAQEYPPAKRMIAEALPVMEAVVRHVNQSCHLGVLDNAQVVILAQVDSPAAQGFFVKAGSTVDLMHAASGHVILAFQQPERRDHAIQRWSKRTRQKPPSDLEGHLDKIRRAGFEERASYLVKGVTNVSYPILDETNSAVAALTVPYIQRTDGSSLTEVRKQLSEASRQITSALGGHPSPLLSSRRVKATAS